MLLQPLVSASLWLTAGFEPGFRHMVGQTDGWTEISIYLVTLRFLHTGWAIPLNVHKLLASKRIISILAQLLPLPSMFLLGKRWWKYAQHGVLIKAKIFSQETVKMIGGEIDCKSVQASQDWKQSVKSWGIHAWEELLDNVIFMDARLDLPTYSWK